MTADLLTTTLAELAARRGQWPAICRITGLDYDWLTKLAQGRIADPGVRKIQRLAVHFVDNPRPAPEPPDKAPHSANIAPVQSGRPVPLTVPEPNIEFILGREGLLPPIRDSKLDAVLDQAGRDGLIERREYLRRAEERKRLGLDIGSARQGV